MFVFTISAELFTRSDAKTDAEENDKVRELGVNDTLRGVIKKPENIVLETVLEGWKIEIDCSHLFDLQIVMWERETEHLQTRRLKQTEKNCHFWDIVRYGLGMNHKKKSGHIL